MADIKCKDRKTGEIKILPEPVFDVVNDSNEIHYDFICYVDESGQPLTQSVDEIVSSFQPFQAPTGSENIPKKRGPKPKGS